MSGMVGSMVMDFVILTELRFRELRVGATQSKDA
ncbi:hypothetical protein FHS15_003800 [Paenibacillus castaneae]|nr:hypothetical protein [Paenibacillus castaneae]